MKKPFDLSKALSGAPLITAGGKTVLDFNRLENLAQDPKNVASVAGTAYFFYDDGRLNPPNNPVPTGFDLFLGDTGDDLWVGVYKDAVTPAGLFVGALKRSQNKVNEEATANPNWTLQTMLSGRTP